MPVTVNATLSKSFIPVYLALGFYALMLALLVSSTAHWSVYVICLATLPLAICYLRQSQQLGLLRWQGRQLSIVRNGTTEQWQWFGRGRISSQFISWQLQGEDGRSHYLVVWRGQLTEASWRACNMAFTVWRGQLSSTLEPAPETER